MLNTSGPQLGCHGRELRWNAFSENSQVVQNIENLGHPFPRLPSGAGLWVQMPHSTSGEFRFCRLSQ